jgi:hypothetical protein
MNKIILLITLVLAAGCSPLYKTTYEYLPLNSAAKESCASACNSSFTICTQNATAINQQCQTGAEISYQLCQASQLWGYDNKGNYVCLANCFCMRSFCADPDFEPCNETHRSCYIGCGGSISALTECVRNCEKASPPTEVILGEQPATTKSSTSKTSNTNYQNSTKKGKSKSDNSSNSDKDPESSLRKIITSINEKSE